MLARQSQAQMWNRTGLNFCTPRAQWPGLNGGAPLKFCAPELLCLPQGITPVMGVLGGRRIWTRSVHPEPSPGDPLVTFPSLGKPLAAAAAKSCPPAAGTNFVKGKREVYGVTETPITRCPRASTISFWMSLGLHTTVSYLAFGTGRLSISAVWMSATSLNRAISSGRL